MTKNRSRKLREVFVLIIPQVIRIHFSKWEVVVVCRPRRRMRIYISIIPQVIRISYFKFGESLTRCQPDWEVIGLSSTYSINFYAPEQPQTGTSSFIQCFILIFCSYTSVSNCYTNPITESVFTFVGHLVN